MAIEDLDESQYSGEEGPEMANGEEAMPEEREEHEESYEERRTKEKAVEDFERLKKLEVDFTNYERVYNESLQTLGTLRLLVGVEDHRLQKIAEDINIVFQSIQRQNIRRGSGGVYEEPAVLLRQAMEFFEDRKELTELERAYLKVLSQKIFKALAIIRGIEITNRAIEVMKELQTERMKQQEQNIREWVQNKLESLDTKLKSTEEIAKVTVQLNDKENVISQKETEIKSLTEKFLDLQQKYSSLSEDLEREKRDSYAKVIGLEQTIQTFQNSRALEQMMRQQQQVPAMQPYTPYANPVQQPQLQQPQMLQQQPQRRQMPIAQEAEIYVADNVIDLDTPNVPDDSEKSKIIELIGEEEYNRILAGYDSALKMGKNVAFRAGQVAVKLRRDGFSPKVANKVANFFTRLYRRK